MTGSGKMNVNNEKREGFTEPNFNENNKNIDKLNILSKDQILTNAFNFHTNGNIREAEKQYKYFLDQGFKDPRVFSNYGVICQRKGNIKKAMLLYQECIKLYPNVYSSYLNLGIIVKNLGNLDKSAELFRKAIELNPKSERACLNLGSVLSDLRQLKEAEFFTRKAIKINPQYSKAYYNLSSILCLSGNIYEAERSLIKAIELRPDYADAFFNLGSIFRDQRRLDEAENAYRKALDISPKNVDYLYNLANNQREKLQISEAKKLFLRVIKIDHLYFNAYNNLGEILKSEGKFVEAEEYILKAIDINPNLSKSYFMLSNLPSLKNHKKFRNNLFSKDILHNSDDISKIDIYFARSNILHKENNYEFSSKYLRLANDAKLKLYKSDINHFLKVSNDFLLQSASFKPCRDKSFNENIFIVGMPRSGSTLIESILSLNPLVHSLGEINCFEESLISANKSSNLSPHLDINSFYKKLVNNYSNNSRILTNKWLYNYIYTGIILSKIPNSRIIHCVRNPLDNILSLYRAHFYKGNRYSSSINDCAKLYLSQDRIMSEYKSQFPSLIFELNYDLLVTDPEMQIKSLISWLNWDWHDYYLKPNLSTRFVATASSVQVRSEINNRSVGGWKSYQNLLKPAIDILSSNSNYENIFSR